MKSASETVDRQPAAAGKFYPAAPDKLQQELENIFASAIPKRCNNVRAIICPHAGYIYSGQVAASAFNQIDGNAVYKRIFIIGSSHQVCFEGAAVYCDGDFLMPYGKERVDTVLGKMLVATFPKIFTADRGPHQNEHSLEVQLPLLHHVLKTEYCIVPIVIGTSNPALCREIASALKPYLTPENLFIISSDFSHYPNYADAQKVDAITKEAIVANNPEILLTTLRKSEGKRITHLVTSLCGWTSVLSLLYMTTNNDSLEYSAIDYRNSGDTEYYGEKNGVVGYWGIVISEKSVSDNDFQLSDKDKAALLNIAWESVKSAVLQGKKEKINPDDYSATLKTKCGAFVTLNNKGRLRGCIGRMTGDFPLYKMVQEMAISAALYDYRFHSVRPEELANIDLEISILSPLRKIDDIAEIQIGKHGIYIENGVDSGVFLPQVATDTGWSKEEFLGHCARDKAGLGWSGWKTADIYIFTATILRQ
ncbi:MAG: AmmeMemoRadiSam system protein B [Bacteroidales bacterium]